MASAHNRIKGARLAGGYLMAVDAAVATRYSRSNYARLEAGEVRLSPKYAQVLASLFGCTIGFLTDGTVGSKIDRLAMRIAEVIEKAPELAPDAAGRLRSIRLDANYASARAAAAAMGWAIPTYSAHESGGKPMSSERLISYALAFGVRPEYAVLGTGSAKPKQSEAAMWWGQSPRPSDTFADKDPVSWRWLNRQKNNNRDNIPLVDLGGGKPHIAEDGPLTLPRRLLGGSGSISTPCYGLMQPTSDGLAIWVIDPAMGDGRQVMLSADRGLRTVPNVSDFVPYDLVRRGIPVDAERPLGHLIRRIVILD